MYITEAHPWPAQMNRVEGWTSKPWQLRKSLATANSENKDQFSKHTKISKLEANLDVTGVKLAYLEQFI